jgi:hypothetical protein
LLPIASISFFDARHIHLHLPSFYNLDQLPELFSSSNFTPHSPEEIRRIVKLEIENNFHIKKAIISLSGANITHITLRKFWGNDTSKFTIFSSNFLQILCDSLMKYGLFLSSLDTEEITLNNGTNKVTLVSSDTVPLTASFEDNKKKLCFKRFHLPSTAIQSS